MDFEARKMVIKERREYLKQKLVAIGHKMEKLKNKEEAVTELINESDMELEAVEKKEAEVKAKKNAEEPKA